MAKRYSDNLILLRVYKLQSSIMESLGNNQEALSSFKKHFKVQRESDKKIYNDDLRQIKFRLEAELSEKQILERDNALLLSKAKNQKLTLIIYTALFFTILMLISFLYKSKLNAEKRKQLLESLKWHKAKFKDLDKPLINFKRLFKGVKSNILICNDAGFLIYSNIVAIQNQTNYQGKNIKELSLELNSELERCISNGGSISFECFNLDFLSDKQYVTITPFIDSEYFVFEFLSSSSPSLEVSSKLIIANRFAQSINSMVIDSNDIGMLRPIIVTVMEVCINAWVRITDSNKVELADKSKIWKVNIDEGRLRTRSLDRYLSLNTLPKQPRLKNVIKTCHFLLSHKELTSFERETIESNLNKILAFDKS